MTQQLCEWDILGGEAGPVVRCVACGHKARPLSLPYYRRCRFQGTLPSGEVGIPPENLPCPHRGERVGTEVCQFCYAKGKPVAVFSCQLYGRCTVDSFRNQQVTATGIRFCTGCRDRKN